MHIIFFFDIARRAGIIPMLLMAIYYAMIIIDLFKVITNKRTAHSFKNLSFCSLFGLNYFIYDRTST